MLMLRAKLYNKLIKPKSTNPDDQRRELIFNVLIGLFTVAAVATMISSTSNHLVGNAPKGSNSLPVTAAFLLFVAALWALSRKGKYRVGATILIGLIWLASLQLSLAWSFELPMAQLVNVLVIVVAGVVLSARASVLFTLLVSGTTLLIAYYQINDVLSANIDWLTTPLEMSDAVGQVVLFGIIGGVSWLSNKEIDSLLRRAWRSEAALSKERDQLELTVAERTRQLEQTQLERTLELQRFAEYGRVSASLVHDLASPLTAASLSIEQAEGKVATKVLNEAMTSLRHIENYITSTRKQLQGSGQSAPFSAVKEVGEVVALLQKQAQMKSVSLKLNGSGKDVIYGDPTAFHRVLANLVLNAIQAYSRSTKRERVVYITIKPQSKQLVVTLQDFGTGIRAQDIPHIFDDFYSTKKHIGRGLGLGLANAKRVIEHEFGGTITAVSKPTAGTLFTIEIPLHEKTRTRKPSKRA